MTVAEILSSYGPMGMGWIAAIFLWRENAKLHEKVYNMAITDIEVITGMTQRIKDLAAIIEKGFGVND